MSNPYETLRRYSGILNNLCDLVEVVLPRDRRVGQAIADQILIMRQHADKTYRLIKVLEAAG